MTLDTAVVSVITPTNPFRISVSLLFLEVGFSGIFFLDTFKILILSLNCRDIFKDYAQNYNL